MPPCLPSCLPQVQPIMKRRSWIVPLVSEFYPPNPRLLGLNIGGGGGASSRSPPLRWGPPATCGRLGHATPCSPPGTDVLLLGHLGGAGAARPTTGPRHASHAHVPTPPPLPPACLLARRTGRTREIRVRVRRAGDKLSLLPEESVLGTMLHELVHNVRGPHDRSVRPAPASLPRPTRLHPAAAVAQRAPPATHPRAPACCCRRSVFYKLLDEITDECDDLIAKVCARASCSGNLAGTGPLFRPWRGGACPPGPQPRRAKRCCGTRRSLPSTRLRGASVAFTAGAGACPHSTTHAATAPPPPRCSATAAIAGHLWVGRGVRRQV